jgi:hypothetical protein
MGTIVGGAPNLTITDADFEKRRRSTFAGMASWATGGSAGTTCRECIHWNDCERENGNGRYSSHGRRGGLLKPRACDKYRSLMNGKVGPAVPPDTPSCRFFQAAANPPAIYK